MENIEMIETLLSFGSFFLFCFVLACGMTTGGNSSGDARIVWWLLLFVHLGCFAGAYYLGHSKLSAHDELYAQSITGFIVFMYGVHWFVNIRIRKSAKKANKQKARSRGRVIPMRPRVDLVDLQGFQRPYRSRRRQRA